MSNGQMVPFNLSVFSAEKNVGAKQASIWRLNASELFHTFDKTTPYLRLSAQTLD